MKGRKGKPLAAGQYQRILQNPLYYGVFRYNSESYEGTHEPIITKKLFDTCQEVMSRRGKPKKAKRHFVLRGLMRCGECGRMITAEIQKGYTYYRCTKRFTNCKQKYVREEELAAQIQAILQKVSLWFERAKDFVTDLNRVSYTLREGNLESQREYLEKIGLNFILKERRINFSSEGTFRHYLSNAPYQTWRCVLHRVRTHFKATAVIASPPKAGEAI